MLPSSCKPGRSCQGCMQVLMGPSAVVRTCLQESVVLGSLKFSIDGRHAARHKDVKELISKKHSLACLPRCLSNCPDHGLWARALLEEPQRDSSSLAAACVAIVHVSTAGGLGHLSGLSRQSVQLCCLTSQSRFRGMTVQFIRTLASPETLPGIQGSSLLVFLAVNTEIPEAKPREPARGL